MGRHVCKLWVDICVDTCVDICVGACVQMCVDMYVDAHIVMCIQMCICVCANMYKDMHIEMCAPNSVRKVSLAHVAHVSCMFYCKYPTFEMAVLCFVVSKSVGIARLPNNGEPGSCSLPDC